MTKVYLFNDGSLGFYLLENELKERGFELEVKDVNPSNSLIEWLTKIEPKDQKIYLHFCYEDYTKDHEKLRLEIQKAERLGFRNLLVKEYEGMDRRTMEQMSKFHGFKSNQEAHTENMRAGTIKYHVGKDEDVHEVKPNRTQEQLKLIKETTVELKPGEYIINEPIKLDPDDEMKSTITEYPDRRITKEQYEEQIEKKWDDAFKDNPKVATLTYENLNKDVNKNEESKSTNKRKSKRKM